MKIKIILLGITILFFFSSSHAQVTIGSNLPPRKGTILDLKENGNIEKQDNAKKGLGLPRVALTSLSKLTIADDSQKDKHIGIIVYNITPNSSQNPDLSEGTYCWFGNTWKQVVLVDDAGTDGNLLKSNGDYTYGWTNISIPDYKFWKPSQKALFDASKSTPKEYKYNDVVSGGGNPGIFASDFVYTETMDVKTDASADKFLLIEIVANVTKTTVGNRPAVTGFWEQMQVDVFINNDIVKTYQRIFSTPKNTVANSTIDLFAVVPLNTLSLGKGNKTLKVRVSNIANTYTKNGGSGNGQFQTGTAQLLKIEVTNFGFILYEEE